MYTIMKIVSLKNKPDSLTNQGLPGVNIVKICLLFQIRKSSKGKFQNLFSLELRFALAPELDIQEG